jgi:hypothetical protein
VGCQRDSQCADAGLGARCDVSAGLTFGCQLPPQELPLAP